MLIFVTWVVNVRWLVWLGEDTNRDSLCRQPLFSTHGCSLLGGGWASGAAVPSGKVGKIIF